MSSQKRSAQAFISTLCVSSSFFLPKTFFCANRYLHHAHPVRLRKSFPQMAVEETTPPQLNNDTTATTSTTTPETVEATERADSQNASEFRFNPPSLDTTAFSDFLDSAQIKVDQLREKATNLDTDQVIDESQKTFRTLIDNALAGEWLNRGELYGGIQLLFVFLLLRSPGILDSLGGFLVGPVAMLAGAIISAKGVWDLGRKQLSIWPAPVPEGQLRMDGLYSHIRHPVYAGLILSALGWSSTTGSIERFLVTLVMIYFLTKKIAVEEKFLRETYREYEEYQKQVPSKLIPKIW